MNEPIYHFGFHGRSDPDKVILACVCIKYKSESFEKHQEPDERHRCRLCCRIYSGLNKDLKNRGAWFRIVQRELFERTKGK